MAAKFILYALTGISMFVLLVVTRHEYAWMREELAADQALPVDDNAMLKSAFLAAALLAAIISQGFIVYRAPSKATIIIAIVLTGLSVMLWIGA